MLYIISMYYVLFSKKSSDSLRKYLPKILNRPISWRDLYRHYLLFAKTLIDRLHFVSGNESAYQIKRHGFELVDEIIQKKQGCILLSAHMGTFEVLRILAKKKSIPVKVLMNQENAHRIKQIFQQVNPTFLDDVLAIGEANTIFKVREAVQAGYLVGMLGDRMSDYHEKKSRVMFLGEATSLPQGPILLAHLLNVPIILFFGINHGNRQYDVYFEKFADVIELPKESAAKEAAIQHWLQQYMDRISQHLQKAPHNWFNFYDFWQQ